MHSYLFVGIDLIRQLLTVDPKKRLSVSEALKHPWLQVDSFTVYVNSKMCIKELPSYKNLKAQNALMSPIT